MRFEHLLISALCQFCALSIWGSALAILYLSIPFLNPVGQWQLLFNFSIYMALGVAWAFLLRGGISFWFSKIVLVNAAGRRAASWRCALRAFWYWAPLMALIGLMRLLPKVLGASSWDWMGPTRWDWIFLVLIVLLFAFYILSALWSPTRAPQDRLAGTFLVPR